MPDRFQRIWAIVERIDREPGLDRRQLAEEFALSERQLQADLLVVKDDMGLPLERRRGYRFAPTANGSGGDLDLTDAVLLARLARTVDPDSELTQQLGTLLPRLVGAFPARLQPFARAVLSTAEDGYHAPDILVALVEALLARQVARIRLATKGPTIAYEELTVAPQLLIPFDDSWYLLGYCHERQRDIMILVDELDPAFVEILNFVRV
jgi:predicted DNA-binding transcriptional regulator YafY